MDADFLVLVGGVCMLKYVLQWLHRLYSVGQTYVLPRIWHNKDFPKRYGGKWAVITGASEGIGRAYAFKLAERKMNVFLISRNTEKLQKVADCVEKLHGVQTRCFPMDLCHLSSTENYGKMEEALKQLDIGVLVNNVGQMYDKLRYFLTVSKTNLDEIVYLNITGTVLMTRIVLPQMVVRGNGAIINIGSGSSVKPVPLMAVYSATKKAVDDFTQALNYEYRLKGLFIQVIQPFYVSTKMTGLSKPNFFMVDPEVYVESAIRTVGVSHRNYGYWSHAMFGFLGECLPQRLFMFLAVNVNTHMYSWLTGFRLDTKKMH